MRRNRRLFGPMELQILVSMAAGKTQAAIASELKMAQPAVSKHLRVLERNVGTALVRRDGRRIRLTPLGHCVADAGSTILAMIDNIETTIRSQQAEFGGFVRVIACSTPGAYVLPKAVGEFLPPSPEEIR